jgi:hypothetical protein
LARVEYDACPRHHPEDDSVHDPRAWIGARSSSGLDTGWFSEAGEQPADLAWRSHDAVGIGYLLPLRWEFAVSGLGTPAPIAPTKFLVTTALDRYVRNPMYIGVFGVLLGEAATFHSMRLLGYAAFLCIAVQLFVVYYEEPTLRRRFGDSYELYRRSVPRWIPRL